MALNIFGLQGSNYDLQLNEQRKIVQDEFPSNATDCVTLDETIKRISDKEALLSKNALKGVVNSFYLTALREQKATLESTFSGNSCRDKIENIRLKTAGILITKGAIKQELTLLPKNNKEQQIYLTLGAVVLLVGLYIVSKK